MGLPAVDAAQYFLGIDGKQSGPFKKDEVIARIQKGEISQGTLVWYDSLPHWTPLGELAEFSQMLRPGEPPPKPVHAEIAAAPQVSSNPNRIAVVKTENFSGLPPSTFSRKGDAPEAIFKGSEGVFASPKVLETRMGLLALGVGGMAILASLIFFFYAGANPSPDPALSLKTGLKKPVSREARYRLAKSELTIKSRESLESLSALLAENPDDEIGKGALEAALDFYQRNRRYQEAAELLFQAKKFPEAAELFLNGSNDLAKAEKSLFAAYEATTDTSKKHQLLVRNVGLLLGPLHQEELALQRIQILRSDFPGIPHPYAYYLRPESEKIKDIFGRLKSQFEKTLVGYIASEFPEMALGAAPAVALSVTGNKYRIVSNYAGPVRLDRDNLPNVKLAFWLAPDQWHLVDTDLTPQRKVWAAQIKSRLKDGENTGAEMLQYLETAYRSQYPKNALHDPAPSEPAL